MTSHRIRDNIIPTIVVEPRWTHGVWRLYWAEPCPWCGTQHYHGGGNDPAAPSFGSRGLHCSGSHRAFRADCLLQRERGQPTRCRQTHVRPTIVELVPA